MILDLKCHISIEHAKPQHKHMDLAHRGATKRANDVCNCDVYSSLPINSSIYMCLRIGRSSKSLEECVY